MLKFVTRYEDKYEVGIFFLDFFCTDFYQKAELNHFIILQFSNYSKDDAVISSEISRNDFESGTSLSSNERKSIFAKLVFSQIEITRIRSKW